MVEVDTREMLCSFYILFYIHSLEKQPSFRYTLFSIFLLDQLHLITFKLYYFYRSCYKV